MKEPLAQVSIHSITLLIVFMSLFTPVHQVAAQNRLLDGITDAGDIDETLKTVGGKTAAGIIGDVINFLLSLVAVLALGALIWGAVSYITSLGSDEKVQKAKRVILYAIIGLLLVGAAFLIVNVVKSILVE